MDGFLKEFDGAEGGFEGCPPSETGFTRTKFRGLWPDALYCVKRVCER
jgi:hypothetical protein